MRRIVAALLVAFLALSLAGCSKKEPAATVTTPPAATPATPAVASAADVVSDRSPVETGYPEQFPTITATDTPPALQKKLDAKRPMLIFFYDSTQLETKEQRGEIDAVLKDYRGLIDLVTFNVAGANGPAASDSAKLAALLAENLRAAVTPYIIVVDGGGFITWRWTGYVDREIIGKEVLRATE